MKDPYYKGALTSPLDYVAAQNRNFGNYTLEICQERLEDHRYVIYYRKNSYLVQPADFIIKQLLENGLISYWKQQVYDKKYLERPKQSKELHKLSLDQMMGGIQLFQVGLVIAFLTFLIECLTFNIRRIKFIAEYILKRYH